MIVFLFIGVPLLVGVALIVTLSVALSGTPVRPRDGPIWRPHYDHHPGGPREHWPRQ